MEIYRHAGNEKIPRINWTTYLEKLLRWIGNVALDFTVV